MKNSSSNFGRVIFVLMALAVILSMAMTACAPGNTGLSGGAGQGNQGGNNGNKGGNSGNKGNANTNNKNNTGNQNNTTTNVNGQNIISRCAPGTSDQACKNAQETDCNSHNTSNCPGKPEICGLGLHVGNPHCNPAPTQPPGTQPPGTQPPGTQPPTGCTGANCNPPPPPPDLTVNPAPVPGPNCPNWIVFHTFRTGSLQIFRLDGVEGASGAQLIDLSNSSAMDSRPSRSPDNSQVVFQSNRNGNVELYLTDSEGKSQTRLTTTQANNINAMFGPDNEHVIYQSDRNGNWDIYMLDVKTGTDQQLTSNPADDVNAYWSPDANWVIFQSNRTGTWNLYLLNVSTDTVYSFTNFPYDAVFPSWSPNGNQVSFFTNWNNQWNLYVSDLKGDNVKQITTQGNAGNATWSPDGNRIAYQIDDGSGNTNVFTYDLSNNKQYQLTDFSGPDSAPTWNCGGSEVSFTSTSGGSPNIYSVPWQGGEISYITDTPSTNKWSEWSPAKEPGSRGY